MSEINPHDAAQTFVPGRETLHYLVWCWRADITVLYGIGYRVTGKRCSEMQIPSRLPGEPPEITESIFCFSIQAATSHSFSEVYYAFSANCR